MWLDFLRKKEEKKREIRYILTIDGGGMRGIVPAFILKQMDRYLKTLTSRPLYSFFDLVAGTSTGALLSLGLTCPLGGKILKIEEGEPFELTQSFKKGHFIKKEYTETLGYIDRLAKVGDFLSLYKENGERIFLKRETKGLFKLFDKVSKIFSDKYEIEPYEEFLSELFGEVELKEALIPTMAVAFNAKDSMPYIFRSWDSHDYLVREAARASSSAPTYFAPSHFIDRKTDEELLLLDGGILANNPILAAYIEARNLYPRADEYRIISLSTASKPTRMNPDEFNTNLDWMGPLLSAYSMGNMNISLLAVKAIANTSVLRVWEDVVERQFPLDDTSLEAITSLENAGNKIWIKEEKDIKSFIDEMVNENHIPSLLKLEKRRDFPLLEASQKEER